MKLLHLKVVKSYAVLLVSLLYCFSAFSQTNETHPSHPGHERCSTVKMDSIRHAQNPNLQTNEEFEEWIEKLIAAKKKAQTQGLIINGVYQIPIVVHVLHDGEPVGTGRNLSVAAVQSQIDVMNEDFRRIFGTNGYNTNPDGADTEIEFCLARRRPDGSAFPAGEDGINRIDAGAQFGNGPTYSTAVINGTIKPFFTATQFGGWDPGTYMNFWSIDLQGGLLGYAQFPTTVLGGMGCNAQNIVTDGVVMDYQTIGKAAVTGFPGPFNEGRTATHEVGHWLGLRHIWGDGGCGVDDFCLDTPESDASNGGCPTGHVSCGTVDMIENYMDYTNDLCMNIFTNDQKMRMRTVLENSPIRASLINSDACIPPAVSDASIVGIIDPDGDNCAGAITPTVVLRNRGASNLTSTTIAYTINNGAATTFAWTGNIAPGAEANVILPAFTAPLGIHDFRAYTELPNGVTDPDPTYDTTLIAFAVSNGLMPDQAEDFEIGVFPPNVRWDVDNPNDDCYEWVGQACVSSAGVVNNVAAMMTNFENGTNQDEYLYTPFFILPCNASAANVSFDKAYRRRINGSSDRLRLEMSDDCGATWSTVLFDQSGGTLDGTNGTANGYWIPTTAGEWDNVNIDLLPYVSGTSQSVQFRFRATNAGNGGNLFVDNFSFTATTPGEIDLTVAGADVLDGGLYDFGAGPVGGTVTGVFTITNTGTSNLTLTGPISVTGDAEFALNSTFGTTTVPAGGTTTFSIDFTASGAGPFTGNVTFGTNDCDEGTYNFQLQGSGDVVPPVANFTFNPSLICEGQTVTYTNTSTGAASLAWTFPGGIPTTATGAGPHVVTYSAAGTYNAQLLATNGFGSDTELKTNIITVLGSVALPIAEGFTGAFTPAGWSVGNGGNQAITWTQDPNNNGNAPTAGNSARIDMFTTNTAGDQDTLYVVPANLSGFVSAQMTFDLAYARYNGTFADSLQVLVSDDCGASWVLEYGKGPNSNLATDADQTGGYTSPANWRNETVDLTPYVGNSSVRVAFVAVSGYGQYLYLDNVNLTGVAGGCNDPDVPTLSASPAAVCNGGTSTISIAGNLNDADDWFIYTGSCGGTLVGSTSTGSFVVTPSGPSTTYFVRGEGGCVVPGSCGTVTINVNNATAGSETVIECDSYSWSANGTTYTAGGTYTATLTNAAGCDSVATLNLTINNSNSGSETVIECDSYTWSANGTTYTASGAYTATLTNAAGCDSVATLNLTINNSNSGSETVIECDSYTWSANGTTYTASGAYTATITNAAGCDSVATLNLTINNSNSGSENVTACDTYTWSANGTTYTASGAYTATLTNAAGCDSVATLNLTINNSNSGSENVTACDAYTWSANGTTYTASGAYTATLTNAAGCDSVATLNLTINNSTSGSENVTACNNYTWSANGITYTASGVYTATLTGSNGCDSVATLNLAISTFATGTDVITACDSYTWIDGTTYTTSNNSATFTIVGGSVNGCDSIVSLDLTINNSNSGSETVTACETYTWTANGTTYTASGAYTATLTNAAGCDSTATLNLTINNSNSGSETVIACDSYIWSANGTTYTTSGAYTATLTNAAGCDSIATLNLTINNSTSGVENVTACNNYTWSANGTTYTTGGAYTATLTGSNGCDSVATLNLTISTFATGTDVITSCDSYTWIDGITYTASNNSATFTIVGGSANGCDSIVSLDLTINNSTAGSETVAACGAYTWSANSTTYTASGVYTAILTNAAGCDSTATLNLTINVATSGAESVTACNSYTWSANSTTYTTSGSFTALLTNAAGCDSTATLNLTINNATSGSENVTACGSYTWSANSTTYTASGSYTATITGSNGCDSTATLNLTIATFTTGTDIVSACGSYTWIDGTTYMVSNNTATFTIVGGSVNGCDSIVSLDLTVGLANTGFESVTSCGPYLWSTSGVTYTSSGSYSTTLTNASGCDSVVTLSLTVNNPTSSTETITSCGSYLWSATGVSYASSGIYTTTLTGSNGCDSVATLNLTVGSPTFGTENITACSSYTWTANGVNYTSSGIYTAVLPGSNGCDSTATLSLTINNSTAGSESATACDSYTWTTNGATYTSTGIYTALLTGSNGCDSTAFLSLTINNSTAGSETVAACNSYTWTANGMTYTSSGAYTAVLTNALGCDSTATLNLTINTPTAGSENVSACESYTWSANGTTYTSSGTYNEVITGSNGCDSTATLNLTINNSVVATDAITACDSFTWLDGVTYTSSNNSASFIIAGGASNGCDSIVNLDLTINNSSTGSETASACESFVWTANGATYTATGTYTAVLTNATGCDSTVTLDLTVFGLPTVGLILNESNFCDTDADISLAGGTPAGGTYTGFGVTAGVFSPTIAGVGNYAITYEFTDANGCTASAVDSILVQDCSHIDEISATVVTIYPNPTSGVVTLSSNGANLEEVRVFDNAGKLIDIIELGAALEEINITSYARGVYQFQIKAGEFTHWERIVKN